MGYILISVTIVLSVYGQLVLKWRMDALGELPFGFIDKTIFLVKAVFDPWIFSTFAAAFIGSLTWMAALTKLDLSHAYPFVSLSFVGVLVLSAMLLDESMNAYKIAGNIIIVTGFVVCALGIENGSSI